MNDNMSSLNNVLGNVNMLMDTVDNFLNFLTPKVSFGSFLDYLSDYFDTMILEQTKNSESEYTGGFCILFVESQLLKVASELYYKKNESYEKYIYNGEVALNRFTKHTIENEIKEIISIGKMKIFIEEPG